MRFKVRYLDGAEVDVTASASARHLYEQNHTGSLLDAIRSGRSDWADEVVHTTLFRSKQTALDLLEWLDTVEAVMFAVDEDAVLAIAELSGVVPSGRFRIVKNEDASEVGPTGPLDGAPSLDA